MTRAQIKAPVQIVMPEVKLTIADLAYMTGLMSGGTRCQGAGVVKDRLTFLGLIEYGDIPPCPKAVAEHEKKEADNRAAVKAAIRANEWGKVFSIGNSWNYDRRRKPTATKDYILTASGREFMAKGRATSITSMKGGCAK